MTKATAKFKRAAKFCKLPKNRKGKTYQKCVGNFMKRK